MTGISEEAGREAGVGPYPRTSRRIAWFLLAGCVLGAMFAAGYLPKLHARERLTASVAPAPLRAVVLATPKPLPRERALRISATLKPFEHAALHARASGYVRRWLVDLGAHVKTGQLLAEIDTPELDHELDEALARLVESEAELSLARASRDFASATLRRYRELAANKLTSTQELDRCQAEMDIAEAKVQVVAAQLASLTSNTKRLEQLKSFARVAAPFDGTITSRQVERGVLVSASSAPLFELASVDPLRVSAAVPQSWALGVQAGIDAQLTVAEYPARKFAARVARSAGKLDESSRTLYVELEVPNPQGELLPGMFGSVELTLRSTHDAFSIPSSALLTGQEGTQVAVVGEGDRVALRPVLVQRDNGAEVELAEGVSERDRIVVNPGSGLREGSVVRPAR
ncbi:MAG TPA: efflux RND transporter periplasmic adaptor subunit [Polyangiales bacterium]